MAQEEIKIGFGRHNSGGDPDRVAFEKINRMFAELYEGSGGVQQAIRTSRMSFVSTAYMPLRDGELIVGKVIEEVKVNSYIATIAQPSNNSPVVIDVLSGSTVVGTITFPAGAVEAEIVWAGGVDHVTFPADTWFTFNVINKGQPRARGLIITAR